MIEYEPLSRPFNGSCFTITEVALHATTHNWIICHRQLMGAIHGNFSARRTTARLGHNTVVSIQYFDEGPDGIAQFCQRQPDLSLPHETTGDQMYSESQFESYRSLGETAIEKVIAKNEVKDLADLFDCVKKNFGIEDKPPFSHEAMKGIEGDTG